MKPSPLPSTSSIKSARAFPTSKCLWSQTSSEARRAKVIKFNSNPKCSLIKPKINQDLNPPNKQLSCPELSILAEPGQSFVSVKIIGVPLPCSNIHHQVEPTCTQFGSKNKHLLTPFSLFCFLWAPWLPPPLPRRCCKAPAWFALEWNCRSSWSLTSMLGSAVSNTKHSRYFYKGHACLASNRGQSFSLLQLLHGDLSVAIPPKRRHFRRANRKSTESQFVGLPTQIVLDRYLISDSILMNQFLFISIQIVWGLDDGWMNR